MRWNFFNKRSKINIEKNVDSNQATQPDLNSKMNWVDGFYLHKTFDGEKNKGELGLAKEIRPNFESLRLRSYEAVLTDDIIKGISSKFFKFVIGNGLRLKSEVQVDVLKSEGINFEEKFTDVVETRFKVFSNSKYCDYSSMNNLHKKALDCFQTAFLGGDCLVVCRMVNNIPTIQLIDGQRVKQPEPSIVSKSENKIVCGVEINNKGTQIAFWIDGEERIEARGKKTGRLMAWMVYFGKHRIDDVRGVPAMASILEKAKKADRYSEAIVGSAEERAKIAYSIEHNDSSTGENPTKEAILNKVAGTSSPQINSYDKADLMASKIIETTGKQTFNMPIGSKLTTLESKQESVFGEFFDVILGQICAALDLPPEVAKQRYDSNYSASRAAIKNWEYIVEIIRTQFAESFYKPFYSIWLETEILKNKINAIGYLDAVSEGNFMVIESYTFSKFIGRGIPHIDPLKEINAIRGMLGDDTIPLISPEDATEMLDAGDWFDNIKKYAKAKKESDTLTPIKKLENE